MIVLPGRWLTQIGHFGEVNRLRRLRIANDKTTLITRYTQNTYKTQTGMLLTRYQLVDSTSSLLIKAYGGYQG